FGSKEASEDDRQGAIRLVNERAAAGSQPAVFAGDFNSTPGSRTIKTIGETWSQANKDEAATVPVDRPAKQIDFIFLRPADRFKVAEFRVLNEPVASDHLPILAVVELTPATPAK
ncbi:MAG TPA: endonuclease/exonuclease/phosphatase family protein, partial [Pirellulales bacterium]